MRTLIIGALAVTMAGCCSRLPPRGTAASDADGVTSFETITARPVEPVPVAFKPPSAIEKIHTRIAAKSKPPSSARRPSGSSKTPVPQAHDAAAHSSSAHRTIADSHSGGTVSGGAVASPKTPTIQQQVEAATAVAESMAAPGIAAPPSEPDSRIALVMARPEIKSIADLTGQIVALDERQVASRNKVWIAMVAAGAARVLLSENESKPIDRLIKGEVPAAVLTLVSAEAASSFPDVAGYRIFRIPLALRAIDTQPSKQ
jgi:hypothetical protein